MSALGSSVINKSGKKFAPKAPARRPTAPASAQTSARPSVDRQVQSQTPQPQSGAQRVAASPTPSISLPTPSSTQQPVPAPQVPRSERNAAAPTAIPSPTPARRRSSPLPVVPGERPPKPGQSPQQPSSASQLVQQSQASERTASLLAPNEPNVLFPDFGSTLRRSLSIQREGLVSAAANQPITATASSPQLVHADSQAPTAKRRRIGKPQNQRGNSRPSASDANANVPLPTTEANEVAAVASSAAEAQPASKLRAKATETSKIALAKRKQQVEDVAGEVFADATRSPSAKTNKPRKNANSKGVNRAQASAIETLENATREPRGPVQQDTACTKAKRKYTKRKSQQSIEEAAAAAVEDAVQSSSKDATKRGGRIRRAVTPEGAEQVVILTSEVKMADLCKDGRTGRKSERERDLAEHERAEVIRQKQRQLQELLGQPETENHGIPTESADAGLERLERQGREEDVVQHVPNTVIVDGEIRIDDDSLQIDRHARAAVERAAEQLEAIDETDLTHKINSASWLKRDRSGGWNELLTERFYDGLRMFGTDFEMISKMFPGRTRHKIKLKFVKEEKINYGKIRATLLGEKIPVDLSEFEKMAGTEFDDPKELEREMAEDRRRLEEETAAEKRAMDDAKRERDEQIAAERAAAIAAGDDSSAKENWGRKSKKKTNEKGRKGECRKKEKQAKRSATAGGDSAVREPGEVLGAAA